MPPFHNNIWQNAKRKVVMMMMRRRRGIQCIYKKTKKNSIFKVKSFYYYVWRRKGEQCV